MSTFSLHVALRARSLTMAACMIALVAGCEIPTQPLACADADAVAVGSLHSCAIRSGEVWCWGYNQRGQLGLGDTAERHLPTRVPGIGDAVAIDAGREHTCVLHADGGVSCWGWNRDGQIGNGAAGYGQLDESAWDARVPVRVEGLGGATGISAAESNTCARTEDGLALCWGYTGFGSLGTGGATSGSRPAEVGELPYTDEIYAGGCARAGESVFCWGHYASGDGTNEIRLLPVRITGAEPSLQLERDGLACSLIVGGRVRCWGFGLGGDDPQLTPLEMPGLSNIERIDVGNGACAWDRAGDARCWGANVDGNLGDGSRHPRPEPIRMPHWDGAHDVALGGSHSCGIRADGTLACTGYNVAGQLGDGTTTDHYTPRCVLAFGS